MKPMISDWAEDQVTDVPDAARAAAAATYRSDRPQRATRGLRPIPRPVAKRGRGFWLLLASGLIAAVALLGFLVFGGAGGVEPVAEAAETAPETLVPPVATSVEAPAAVPSTVEVAPTVEVVPPTPTPVEAAPVEREPLGAPPAAPEPPAAAAAAHGVEAEAPTPPSTVPLAPTPPALKAFLRCPPNACQRFGDLVMVNRGPLKLYADPSCKKPISAVFASGQTVVAAGADCFAVELPR